MSNTIRKYIALIVIVVAMAVSVFGIARAAANFSTLGVAALDDSSSGSPEPTETLEPTQAPEMTETAEPTEAAEQEIEDAQGDDVNDDINDDLNDDNGEDSSSMDDNSSGEVSSPDSQTWIEPSGGGSGRGGSGSGGGGTDDGGGHH
jgi:uncharacterized membrane protein YgcG